jgi:hypothetical protein
VPALWLRHPGRDDRPGTPGPHDVLLPGLSGRPRADRRRSAPATDGLHRRRQAGEPGAQGSRRPLGWVSPFEVAPDAPPAPGRPRDRAR